MSAYLPIYIRVPDSLDRKDDEAVQAWAAETIRRIVVAIGEDEFEAGEPGDVERHELH